MEQRGRLYPEDDYDDTGQLAAQPSAARALYKHARPLEEPAIPPSAETLAEADAEHFERDPQDGVRLLSLGAPGTTQLRRTEVYLMGKALGQAGYHRPQPGAGGLEGTAYWYALTLGERFVNRVSDPPEIELSQTATTGQSSREQAIGLLLAAHTAGLQ